MECFKSVANLIELYDSVKFKKFSKLMMLSNAHGVVLVVEATIYLTDKRYNAIVPDTAGIDI